MILIWVITGLAGLMALLLTAGWLYQAVSGAMDRRRHPAPGRLIDVGGHRLHLQVSGDGDGPTVVIETGSTNPSILWTEVHQGLSAHTRVCLYDRAGYGWSDPPTTSRTGDQVVQELHTLLQRAGVPGPYLLVGHSLGGLYVRHYARRYPHEVAGLVLVDALQEDVFDRQPESARRVTAQFLKMLVPSALLGLTRLMARFQPAAIGLKALLARMPAALRPIVVGQMSDPMLYRAAVAERACLPALEHQMREASNPGDKGGQGALPVMVLSRGRPDVQAGGSITQADADALWRGWQEGQAALARLPHARQMIVEGAGHALQSEAPDAIIAAVCDMLSALRNQKDLRSV